MSSTVDAARKLDPRRDFFDFSAVFGRPLALPLVSWLVPTRVTPRQVSLGALVLGLAAALAVTRGGYPWLLTGALLLQAKNILDTVDGHLARARRRPSWIGRYLDSLVDFVVGVAMHLALGVVLTNRGYTPVVWIWVTVTGLSAFIQCSYYVFYTVKYLDMKGRSPVSRPDERPAPDTSASETSEEGPLLTLLHRTHLLLYGWQDELVRGFDRWWWSRLARGRALAGARRDEWYSHRLLLSLTSVIGLGTLLAILSASLVLDRPVYYLWAISVGGNLYLVALSVTRYLIFRRLLGESAGRGAGVAQ